MYCQCTYIHSSVLSCVYIFLCVCVHIKKLCPVISGQGMYMYMYMYIYCVSAFVSWNIVWGSFVVVFLSFLSPWSISFLSHSSLLSLIFSLLSVSLPYPPLSSSPLSLHPFFLFLNLSLSHLPSPSHSQASRWLGTLTTRARHSSRRDRELSTSFCGDSPSTRISPSALI